jgi:hypothetical protein
MKSLVCFVALVSLACAASVARAQSPNTSSIIVLIFDQSGATATRGLRHQQPDRGARRGIRADGAATISALPLGSFSVSGPSGSAPKAQRRGTRPRNARVGLLVGKNPGHRHGTTGARG